MSKRVDEFVRLSGEKDDLEWDLFAADEEDDDPELIEANIFELQSRLDWLWDQMTQEEREQVEELL